jgi:hypothetical protein
MRRGAAVDVNKTTRDDAMQKCIASRRCLPTRHPFTYRRMQPVFI